MTTTNKIYKILMVGGGTAGHILPLKPLINECKNNKWEVEIIVADATLDRNIIEKNLKEETTHYLKTDKIRTYFSFKNLLAPFKIIKAIRQAKKILKHSKPDIIFCKGGFVCFPVVWANARLPKKQKAKVFLHESDTTTGRLTKYISKKAVKTFKAFDKKTPYPLYNATIEANPLQKIIKLVPHRPHLLVFGGAQGAQFINQIIKEALPEITKTFSVTLICGKNKRTNAENPHFQEKELLSAKEFQSYLHSADVVVCRGGSGSIFEVLQAKIPSLIIPLPWAARNHQEKNAIYFKEKGALDWVRQKDLTSKNITQKIKDTWKNKDLKRILKEMNTKSTHKEILEQIKQSMI